MRKLLIFYSIAMGAGAANAGTYLSMDALVRDPAAVPPLAIIHPPGYAGMGGELVVRICVDTTDTTNSSLVGPVQRAIELWNALEAITGNCGGPSDCA
jgi:hypothetical protein